MRLPAINTPDQFTFILALANNGRRERWYVDEIAENRQKGSAPICSSWLYSCSWVYCVD